MTEIKNLFCSSLVVPVPCTIDIGMYLSEYLKVKGLFVSDLKKKYTYSERGANFDKVKYIYFNFFCGRHPNSES